MNNNGRRKYRDRTSLDVLITYCVFNDDGNIFENPKRDQPVLIFRRFCDFVQKQDGTKISGNFQILQRQRTLNWSKLLSPPASSQNVSLSHGKVVIWRKICIKQRPLSVFAEYVCMQCFTRSASKKRLWSRLDIRMRGCTVLCSVYDYESIFSAIIILMK